MRIRHAVAISIVAIVGLASCGGADDDSSEAGFDGDVPAATEAPAEAAVEEAAAETEAPADANASFSSAAAPVGESVGSVALDRGVLLNLSGAQQIKLATLKVQVAEQGFSEAVTRANTIVTVAGGFVESSTSEQPTDIDDTRPARGTLVVRVPSERFTDVLNQLADLGEVLEQGFSGQDVSDQMVDLSARIETLLAQETSYREILDKAESIADIVSLQQPLLDVRTQIELLSAQKAALSEQVAYSTITFSITEPETDELPPPPAEPEQGRLAKAWDNARDGFTAVIGGFLVVAVVSVPFIALALVALLIGWPLYRKLRRRSATTTLTSV